MVGFLKEKASLTRVASVLSLFTLVAYHRPFFRLVLDNLEGGFNGVMIAGGLVVVMLALNFLVYYLLLFLGRFVGKCLLAFTLIGNALSLYFINTYQVLITDKMMGNVFNTRYSEASGFFSWDAVWYLLFLGVVPCIYLFARRVDYGSRRRFLTRTGAALALSLAVALFAPSLTNTSLADQHAELALDRPPRPQDRKPDHALVVCGQFRALLQLRAETQPEGDSAARRTDRYRQP